MNCNEEFIVKLLGKLTLEFNYSFEEQNKIRNCVYQLLYNYDIFSREKSLIVSDVNQKIDLYLQVKKLEGYSELTLNNYSYTLRKFAEVVNKPVATITKNDIRYFLILYTEGKEKSTANSITYYIKGFFSWLATEELIPKNPAEKLPIYKLPKRLRKSLTIVELEKLRLACKDPRERALIEFMFATGCRVSEVVSCNIADLDIYKNEIRIIGKGDKERKVYFSDKTKLYLERYLKTRTDTNEALFVTKRYPYHRLGKRGIEDIVNKIAVRAGFNKSVFPHLLRHTMATLGLQAGANLTTIQKLLGHTTPTTTQIYSEQSDENVRNEYNKHLIQ